MSFPVSTFGRMTFQKQTTAGSGLFRRARNDLALLVKSKTSHELFVRPGNSKCRWNTRARALHPSEASVISGNPIRLFIVLYSTQYRMGRLTTQMGWSRIHTFDTCICRVPYYSILRGRVSQLPGNRPGWPKIVRVENRPG